MAGVTVVTGGGHGIGRAIVERLLADVPWARSSPPATPSCWPPNRLSGGPGSSTRSPSCIRWGGRGRLAEVADVVAYLLSDQARYLTGTVLPVDGGRSVLGRDPVSR